MRSGRFIAGVVLVALGVVYLLDQANVVDDAGSFIGRWWPSLLILFGAMMLTLDRQRWAAPVVMMGVGTLLLLDTTNALEADFWAVAVPVGIIALGLWFLFGRRRRGGSGADTVNAVAIFSGRDVVSHSDHFEGGSLVSLFGGTSLDLRDARLAEEGAEIDVAVAFGGADIHVPEGWNVRFRGLPLFAGVSNKVKGDVVPPDAPSLVVSGVALFGGIDIDHGED